MRIPYIDVLVQTARNLYNITSSRNISPLHRALPGQTATGRFPPYKCTHCTTYHRGRFPMRCAPSWWYDHGTL